MILSVFPSLFSYTLLGIFVLRVALGLVILRLAFTTLFKINRPESWIKGTGIVLLLVGILLVIGLYTQIAALVVTLASLLAVIIKIRVRLAEHQSLSQGVEYYFLLLAIAVSLLFLGAGAFAIDLPL
jgi:uncharacterized membrane protein YphA (DoxX/SURF4 family)